MTEDVYITAAGAFLPGDPITNDEMEDYLGRIDGQPSASRTFVLRQNKITRRHYALDREGNAGCTNAQMAAHAVREAIKKSELTLQDIEYLAAATTQGDLLVPGFASAVHGELQVPPLEIASFQSVCASSMMAFKSACLQIRADGKASAAVAASEFSSRWFRPGFYEEAFRHTGVKKAPFETEFLRWTLSDGGGALVLENRPNTRGLSLKVEWVDLRSYADRFPPCMYAGSAGNDPDEQVSWSQYASPAHAMQAGAVMLKQDFDLLYAMFPVWVARYLELVEEDRIEPARIDHLLAHYSAHSLRLEMIRLLERTGGMIPEEKWFTNLYTKGNTGSASLFIMLEELFYSGRLRPGETILCFVPESGRSIIAFMLLTVV